MENFLSIVNELQKLINLSHVKVDISLPQIIVVGAQSAGKSSVLESIVGKDFLPRGSGIVTRLPLIIQCQNCDEEFATFQHSPETIYTDFAQVREEIIAETNKKAGKNKGIIDKPILLEIYSPKVVDITLVDLPGLTKNPVGDQPRNISALIEKMVIDYISRENAIILAISPGNNDIANSDALKIARDVDPKGERTLGVITKLDIMDKGTSAINVLLGEEYPLNHGYVGVVCRSQGDINNNMPISDHLEKEAEFFSTHPIYKQIQDQTGIPFLTQRLQEILFDKLKECLPTIKEGIDRQLDEKRRELKDYGDPVGGNEALQRTIIIRIIDEYHKFLEDALDGRRSKNIEDRENTFETGTKIRKLLFSFFEDTLRKINPIDKVTDEEILDRINSSNGIYGSLLIPEQAFRQITEETVKSLKQPSLKVLDLVKDSLSNLTRKIPSPYFFRFKQLHYLICDATEKIIDEKYQQTEIMIKRIFDMECNYININHPDFIGAHLALEKSKKKYDEANASPLRQGESPFSRMSEPAQNRGLFPNQPNPFTIQNNGAFVAQNGGLNQAQQSQSQSQNSSPINRIPGPSPSDIKNIELMRILVKSYFGIVRKNIGDYVPKAIFNFLIHEVKKSLKDVLVHELLGEKQDERLLDEGKIIPRKREDCKEAINVLSDAKSILRKWDISSYYD